MEITITGRHITVPEKFKDKIVKKIEKLEKYNENIVAAKVILSCQKNINTIEVALSGKNVHLSAKDSTEDMRDSLNGVIEKLETTLKKEREKIKEKKGVAKSKNEEQIFIEKLASMDKKSKKPHIIKSGDIEIVVKTNELLKPISVDEAIVILKEEKLNFYAFNDSNTGRVSVLYKRNDSRYGLIEM